MASKTDFEIDWDGCRPSESVSVSNCCGEAGVLSVINSNKGNGRRLQFANELMEELTNPEKIQVTFYGTTLIVGEKIPNCTISYNVKKGGNKGIVYSGNLVKEITKVFKLDFSNGRVSRTFHDVEYVETDDCVVAVIEMQ